MRAGLGKIAAATLLMAALAACEGGRPPQLMNLRSETRGPDEFGILPTKPLELPQDYAALPPPTPGGPSRTDPTPQADAIAALGGNAGVLARGGAGDGAIVAQATRFGVAPDIRAALADEDLEYRRRNNGRVLERLFNVTVYYKAYRPQSLDQQAELAKWRQRGVRTNSAPPGPQGK